MDKTLLNKAFVNAKKYLRKGDKVRCTKCPGTKRNFIFDKFDGEYMVSKSGLDAYHPVNIDKVNGVYIDFKLDKDFRRIETIFEYHDNGKLLLSTNVIYLTTEEVKKYEYVVGTNTTTPFIRVGLCTKYHKNGIVNWQQEYDMKGKFIGTTQPNRREDGTII